jgi:histidinol-phosphatase (PHP family)
MLDAACLKEKYGGEIELYFGIEQDYYSDGPPVGFDFVIGSVHYLKVGDKFVSVDDGPRSQKLAVDTFFGGDYYAFAEEYYATLADIAKTGADIVGHFDIVTKYNFSGSLFDETHPRYIDAALGAMDEILKKNKLFEVNTGAMYRLGKPEQYPSTFLLRELRKRGGEVILSSDSHDAESICWKFDEMRELLVACGFKYAKRLTQNGFVDEVLPHR